jgi:Acyl-CoA dehydrogenase, C-terminal domain
MNVDLSLPPETEMFRQELARWTDGRAICSGFELHEWQLFAERGLLITQDGESLIETVVALMEVARKGLPGPLLEARLVADSDEAARLMLAEGKVITTLPPAEEWENSGVTPVGWGAVADALVSPSGDVLARGSLPRMQTAYLHPHGWWPRSVSPPGLGDLARRWLLSGALLAGLSRGSLELATEYVKARSQFGKVIGAFQAVQFPLAQCKIFVEGLRLMILDAAWRANSGSSDTDVAAALLCVGASRVSIAVAETCHQVYGAAGLANEYGLNELTWGARWIRSTMDLSRAKSLVGDRRRVSKVPSSLVLEGFARS